MLIGLLCVCVSRVCVRCVVCLLVGCLRDGLLSLWMLMLVGCLVC